jgi:hypothetical protein
VLAFQLSPIRGAGAEVELGGVVVGGLELGAVVVGGLGVGDDGVDGECGAVVVGGLELGAVVVGGLGVGEDGADGECGAVVGGFGVEGGGLAPEPHRFSFAGAVRLALPTERVAEATPAVAGRKVRLNSSVWPGASETPDERPVAEYAEFDTATELMVIEMFPVFWSVTF